jgi:predicted MFS family arabinose efflux permease
MSAGGLRVVILLGVGQILNWGSSAYLPAVLGDAMAAGVGVGTPTLFAAVSVALALSAALGPAAGRWIDATGGRPALCCASVVMAVGLAVLATAQGPTLLWLGWLTLGLGMALGLYEAAFAALAVLYGAQARRAITRLTLIAGFASTVAWPLTAWLEAEYGWRAACLAWAAGHILIGLPAHAALPRGAASHSAAAASPAPDAPPARAMVLLAAAFALAWTVGSGMAAHLPRLLEAAGAAPAAAVAAAALLGPAQVAARLGEYTLMRRAHPLSAARLAALAHPLGAATLGLIGASGAWAFVALHGAGMGLMTIARGAVPLALFGAVGYGRRLGLIAAPARVGQAAAPLLFALLIERFGAGALWVSAAMGLAAAGLLLGVRPTVRDAAPPASS